MMVPHSIATVSLATAMLPRLSAHAADGDLPGVARNVASTLRTTLALIVPFALLLPLVAHDVSNLIWGYAAAKNTFDDFAVALALFAPGLVFFTSHYLMLRGFYALERTRTVFWVQCVSPPPTSRWPCCSPAARRRPTPPPGWSWRTPAPTRSARWAPTCCCGTCWAGSRRRPGPVPAAAGRRRRCGRPGGPGGPLRLRAGLAGRQQAARRGGDELASPWPAGWSTWR